jgi:hypothetical protein
MAPMNPTAPIVWRNLIRRRKAFQRLRQSANQFLPQPKDSGQRNLTLLAANERHPQEIRDVSALPRRLIGTAIQTALPILSVLGRPPALRDEKSKIPNWAEANQILGTQGVQPRLQ